MTASRLRSGARRLLQLALRRPRTAGADADLEFRSVYLELVDHLVGQGLTPEAAEAEALRRLNPNATLGRVRRSAAGRERRLWLSEWLADLGHDLRLVARGAIRTPAVMTLAVGTLALAIGANTAVFSAVNAVLLRPLPFAEPDRLVALWEENPDFGWSQADVAPANMLDWREQVEAFAGVAGFAAFGDHATLTGRGEPTLLTSRDATGDLFTVLDVQPALGRTFTDSETWADGTNRLALLSYRTWRDRFGADSTLVGRFIELNGRPVEVIGVLPEDFGIPGVEADLWRPMRWDAAERTQVWFRRAHWLRAVARLAPGVTVEEADAALQVVVSRLKRDYPATNAKMGAGLTPLHPFLVGNTRLPLLIILGGAAALLLLASATVGNLLLVRAASRSREAGVRLALGAGSGRLLRQSLAESLALAILASGLGLGVGWAGVRLLSGLAPDGLLPVRELPINGAVFAYAAAVTALAAAITGAVPAVWAVRRRPADILRDEGRGQTGSSRARRSSEMLLITQVATALALTLGAGLLVRSYLRLLRVDPGFDPNRVLAVELFLPGTRYDSVSKVLSFFEGFERRVRLLPGVEAVALTSAVPLGPGGWSSDFAIAGRPPKERGDQVVHREISAEYQRVMRVPLLRGRLLTESDRRGAPLVVLVNDAFARLHFGDQDPIGQRIAFDRVPDSTSAWRTIVGVVGNERQEGLGTDPKPEVISPYSQEARQAMHLLVRTAGRPFAHREPLRRVVAELDPLLAITSVRTMDQVRSTSLARDRFLTVLLVAFSGVGLFLCLVGVYAVVAQLARQRVREMGIRMAVGARARQVQWIVVSQGLRLTAIGIAVGVMTALAAARLIRGLLFEIGPADPVVFVAIPLSVLLTTALASWLPAKRVSRFDPSQVLRAD